MLKKRPNFHVLKVVFSLDFPTKMLYGYLIPTMHIACPLISPSREIYFTKISFVIWMQNGLKYLLT
jgi:hypothetical protein